MLSTPAGPGEPAPQEAELADDLPLADGLQGDAGVDEVGVRVRAAFAALPGPQREVLFEVFYRDRSVAETARILQIPPGTVKSRTFYGLRALRRVLAAHDVVAWLSAARPSAGRRSGRARQPYPASQLNRPCLLYVFVVNGEITASASRREAPGGGAATEDTNDLVISA